MNRKSINLHCINKSIKYQPKIELRQLSNTIVALYEFHTWKKNSRKKEHIFVSWYVVLLLKMKMTLCEFMFKKFLESFFL